MGGLGLGNVPNFDAWLQTAWGMGSEFGIIGLIAGPGMIGLSFGQNPPYYLDDFLSNCPQFFGPPTAFAGATLVTGQTTIALPSTTGLATGQFVQVPGMPQNTLVTAVTPTQITVSNVAVSDQSNVNLTAYLTPPVSITIIQLYLNLAYASLVQCRWVEQWTVAMGLFISHYLILYMQSSAVEVAQTVQASIHGEVPSGALPGTVFTLSSAPPTGALQGLYKAGALLTPGTDYTLQGLTITLTNSTSTALYATWPVQQTVNTQVYGTAAQIAAQGLANGILVSKSVGDVSSSYSVLTSLEAWGAWNLTKPGQLLATLAKVNGAGPALVW